MCKLSHRFRLTKWDNPALTTHKDAHKTDSHDAKPTAEAQPSNASKSNPISVHSTTQAQANTSQACLHDTKNVRESQPNLHAPSSTQTTQQKNTPAPTIASQQSPPQPANPEGPIETLSSSQQTAYAALDRLPHIARKVKNKPPGARAAYLRKVARRDSFAYLAWIAQYPEDIPSAEDEDREGLNGGADRTGRDSSHTDDEAWKEERPCEMFGSWSWDRPVVELPLESVGPKNERELGGVETVVLRAARSIC